MTFQFSMYPSGEKYSSNILEQHGSISLKKTFGANRRRRVACDEDGER
jgi:hypothetical protein